MSKSIFILPIHSTIDVITNSSSELFICNTTGTIATIKTAVVAMVENYNKTPPTDPEKLKWWRPVNMKYLFNGKHYNQGRNERIFAEPEISSYTIDLNCDECCHYTDISRHYAYENDTPLHPERLKGDRAMKVWKKLHPEPRFDYKTVKDQTYEVYKKTPAYKKYSKEQNAWRDAKRHESNRVYTVWGKLVLMAYQAMMEHFAEINGIDLSVVGSPTNRDLEYSYCLYEMFDFIKKGGDYKKNTSKEVIEAFKFIESVEEATDWGFSVKAGDILLRSESDNSIPYGLFDIIKKTFNAERRHLG
jgi:hypothetical protein